MKIRKKSSLNRTAGILAAVLIMASGLMSPVHADGQETSGQRPL